MMQCGSKSPVLALLLWLLLLCDKEARAVTVSGFLTDVSSSSTFNIGQLQILLDASTRCEITPTSRLRVGADDHRVGAGHKLYKKKTEVVQCKANDLAIGTLVQVFGALQSSACLRATRMIRYEIRQDIAKSGNFLLEEPPILRNGSAALGGSLSVDGYVVVRGKRGSQDRALCKADEVTGNPTVGMWVSYRIEAGSDGCGPALILSPLQSHPDDDTSEPDQVVEPDYLQHVAGKIVTLQGRTISIVPDKTLQREVREIGSSLVPVWAQSPSTSGHGSHFQFYVVDANDLRHSDNFLSIDGTLPYNASSFGGPEYQYNLRKLYEQVDNTIPQLGRVILIPDRILPRLHDQAQLAALLSFSITSVLQDEIVMAYVVAQSHSSGDMKHSFDWMLEMNERTLRLGIRQMYLSGFDLREAPFAWLVAQGRAETNPVFGKMII